MLIAVKREQKKRELQNDLIKFTSYFFGAQGDVFIENEHHYVIADALKKVEQGEIKNLLINIPPRYGKTEIAVIKWIAQCIAKNPKSKFIHLSYSDDLALDNSSKAKELIQSDEYQKFWKVSLKQDSQSKKKWYTEQGGGLYATAAGGPITGFGAGSTAEDGFYGAIIIDDPLKVDDADRDIERRKINNRLNTTIKSRRNNRNTPIVVIMQRLHEDDMSGFILDNGMGEEFYHVKLPAIKEDGSALWPYKHTLEELEREKVTDPLTFAGQMQQEPSPLEGSYFKREWFNRFQIGDEPKKLTKYGAGDYAVTDGGGDYSEQGIAGFDEIDDLWIVDWWSGQTESDVWINEMLHMGKTHEVLVFVGEKGQIEKSVGPFLKKEMRLQRKYLRIETISHGNKDKPTNARAFQALASQGKVHIPTTPWGEDLLTQLLKFPTGKYDDKVDVCGLFGKILDQTYGPANTLPETKTNQDPYGFDEDDESGWKTG